MKKISILGATGTIGQNTLKIIAQHPGRFAVTALTAGDNVELLIEQARFFKPERAVIANEMHYAVLKKELSGTGIEVAAGETAIAEAASMPADMAMSAMVGAAGLIPTLSAIRSGKAVALANKESLVCAGGLVMQEAEKHGATLLPVDSEHNAVFQLTQDFTFVEHITLTASGGPFRAWTTEQMTKATPEQAIKHPNWNMGAKISVDSATLMNKGLEMIEAHHLFALKPDQIRVLIHPESIVHCLVQMVDGSMLAQLSAPDMCTPIACALAWPDRVETTVKKLNLAEIGRLHFEAPDESRFPALRLARAALSEGGNAACTLNAANEVAVQRFLKGEITFPDIVKTVEKTLEKVENAKLTGIEDVLACDRQARDIAKEL
ncbi:MAG: 1-deoxy-D-xylulose-5-phosphate reductoisomerase [Alphaproteobacteria bacterium]|nr:1-deoxy-D-xylulose-5-phosphate reductoisomerase [Alphaproteobacteria bacterium]